MQPRILSLIVALGAAGAATAVADDGELASGAGTSDTVASIDEAQFLARLALVDPRLERLAADVDRARAEVVAAGVRAEPVIAIDREEVFPDRGVATNYARLTWPLDVSGRRRRRIAAAHSTVAAAQADADRARVEIVIDALRVFYDAAHARLHVDALRTERETLVRVVEIVRKRAGAGAASGYDVQRFELALTAYDDLLTSAETRLFAARTEVAALLGRPDELVDAAASLGVPARPPTLASLVSTALDGRDDLRAARLRGDSADQLAAEAARAWIPGLGLSAGVMSQDVGADTAIGYTVGLAIALPIFDRGRAAGARARAARRTADADARVIAVKVPAALRATHVALERRIAQAELFATAQLSRLEALLRAAETGYREGDRSVVELLDAYQTARDTRLRDLELRRDARTAELDLWLVLGRRP